MSDMIEPRGVGSVLTWAMVIATYNRPKELLECLASVLVQTRLPSEIVVVDSSDDWQGSLENCRELVRSSAAEVPLNYIYSSVKSSAIQRNKGLDQIDADIVFFVDDDSIIYPDYAEKIMRVYDMDIEEQVAGVCGGRTKVPPKGYALDRVAETGAESDRFEAALLRGLRRLVRKWLRASDIFLPYDGSWPSMPVSDELEQRYSKIKTMPGGRFTARSALMRKEPFESVLVRYASGEDSDCSYRLSRHGALLICPDARACHIDAPGGRLNPTVVYALGALNPVVLHRIYGVSQRASRVGCKRLLRRRACIAFFRDLSNGDWGLSSVRGTVLALRYVNYVFTLDLDRLRDWYPEFQERLIDESD